MSFNWDNILFPKIKVETKSRWDKASVTTKHRIIRGRMENNKPLKCPICGKERKLELSNKDHEYKETPADWRYLCHQCHRQYDVKNDNYKFYKRFNSLSYK